jgi:ubiquinone/menaquinone biosynthesis C-methylase UbiE
MSRKDNRSYYDDFATWYENERHGGYHALIDQLQIEVASPFAQDQDVLEIGCGTGMILKELDPISRSAVGIDISPGMLQQAQARGLNVVVGSATDLPFADASFDFICSFKVLAHIEDITKTMSEVSRVLRPGGRAALEFYNKKSIRALIKHLKRPHQISETTHDEEVYTRYDHLDDVKGYLPDDLNVVDLRGVRVFTPFAQVHKIPVVKTVFSVAERFARDQKLLAQFGGFMIVIVEKQHA